MNRKIHKREIDEANYIIESENAEVFNVSKSTVHKDLHERLLTLDEELFVKVDNILKYHTALRHIRGGESTRKKYLNLNN